MRKVRVNLRREEGNSRKSREKSEEKGPREERNMGNREDLKVLGMKKGNSESFLRWKYCVKRAKAAI